MNDLRVSVDESKERQELLLRVQHDIDTLPKRQEEYRQVRASAGDWYWRALDYWKSSKYAYPVEYYLFLSWFSKYKDKYTCQNPQCGWSHGSLHTHHINYHKFDCREKNLITLCRSCHARVHKRRTSQGHKDACRRYFQGLKGSKYGDSPKNKPTKL